MAALRFPSVVGRSNFKRVVAPQIRAAPSVSPALINEHVKYSGVSGFGCASEGVAIKIDEIVIRNNELIAEFGKRIRMVQFFGVVAGRHRLILPG